MESSGDRVPIPCQTNNTSRLQTIPALLVIALPSAIYFLIFSLVAGNLKPSSLFAILDASFESIALLVVGSCVASPAPPIDLSTSSTSQLMYYSLTITDISFVIRVVYVADMSVSNGSLKDIGPIVGRKFGVVVNNVVVRVKGAN
jgi:hypothetical protein